MQMVTGTLRKAGFTLIEVLVTVVVIGVLAAVVIPAVTAQVTAGDSARVISDLNNVRTGIENFDIAVRSFPGDIEDLVNKIVVSTDKDVKGADFVSSQTSLWAGPYLEQTLAAGGVTTGSAFATGYAASLDEDFVGCMSGSSTICDSTTGTADYVTVHINNLTAAQAQTVNDLIDGVGESNFASSGKFRYFAGSTTGYYYASPLK